MTSTVVEKPALEAEFAQLVAGCGFIELSNRATLSITGGDRVRWLNGMITNNVRDLAVGHGIYAFLLNPQGHILADLYAFNRGDSILVNTAQSQVEKILATFDHYIIMDDVEVVNVSDKSSSTAIAGPQAQKVLRAAGFNVDPLERLQISGIIWHEKEVFVVRGDNPAVDWYEIWASSQDAKSICDSLRKSGATSLSDSAGELLRIASGVPKYGSDIRERDLPQETSQERALNFNKGCYIGQEIVERIRSRGAVHRKFAGFEVQGLLPSLGTKIQLDGKDVGEITSVATLPTPHGRRNVALGYIRREIASPDKPLTAGGSRLSLSGLPFAGIFPS